MAVLGKVEAGDGALGRDDRQQIQRPDIPARSEGRQPPLRRLEVVIGRIQSQTGEHLRPDRGSDDEEEDQARDQLIALLVQAMRTAEQGRLRALTLEAEA